MEREKIPYCCAECKHSNFIKYEEPFCTLASRELEHNTAKCVATWCPLKCKGHYSRVREGTSRQAKALMRGCKYRTVRDMPWLLAEGLVTALIVSNLTTGERATAPFSYGGKVYES